MSHLVFRDACPSVADRDDDFARRSFGAHVDDTTCARVLDGVAEQIGEHLLYAVTITMGNGVRRYVVAEREPPRGYQRLQNFDCLSD